MKRILYIIGAALLFATAVTSCAKEEDPNRLPDGEYPVSFTASVEGLTVAKAATRSTVNNSWAGGEQVAVQVGSEVKKYAAARGGTLSSATPLYWQSTANINVTAWHPYSEAKPTTFTVLADQSSDAGFQQSDLIYASQEVLFRIPTLAFKHLPAKVVVNLKNGEGVTATEVTNATVTIENQATTSGAIAADWSVAQVSSGSTSVIPNALTTAASGAQMSVQALVIPQQMQSKQFIKVTINGDNYYYTPTNAIDADLEAGKQYTYTITVQKTGLVVSVGTSVSWGESDLGNDNAELPTFRVTIPTVAGISPTLTGATKAAGKDYYEVSNRANIFSLSYTVPTDFPMNGFVAMQGICNVKRTLESDGKYKFTYTNIRSDLKLAYDDHADVGDFYCKDASGNGYLIPGNVTLTDEQKAACLGVVYWLGDITNDDPLLKEKFPNGTHGLVVALHNASTSATWSLIDGCEYVQNRIDANADYKDKVNIQDMNKMCGYGNTLAIKAYNADNTSKGRSQFNVLPIDLIDTYSSNYTPPANSSDWYFPSIMEMKYVYWGQGNNSRSTTGKDLLNSQFIKAGGTIFGTESFWSSTEYYYNLAWYVSFIDGSVYNNSKYRTYFVRPLLAF